MTQQALRNVLLASSVLGCAAFSTLPSFALPQESKKSAANPNPEFLMEKMTGKWVMRGTIGGDKVTHDVTVDRILNRQSLRIHEIAREKDATGPDE